MTGASSRRILVAGAGGMLGRDLVPVLGQRGHDVVAAGRADLDITSAAQCEAAVSGVDVVINAAAYTAVDAAESDEASAFAINAVGAANLARAAAQAGAALVHVSTDYVVAGEGTQPYPADALIAPLSAYGRTKAAGEWAVRAECPRAWIVRTAWLYGAHGRSFPATMQRLAAEREQLSVVADQIGQPTWTVDLAEGIARIIEADAPFGIWHGTSGGQASWFDLAQAVFIELGLDPARVTPVTTADYPTPATRPAFSVLDHGMWAAAGVEPLPLWREGLRRAAPTVLGRSGA